MRHTLPLFVVLSALTPSALAAPRIVNGSEVAPGEYSEVVYLQHGNSGCTGSLIHPEWVLTAAHCIGWDATEGPDGMYVVFGDRIDAPQREVAASEVHVHPQYVSTDPGDPNALGSVAELDGYDAVTNDIALVRLAEPVYQPLMSLNVAPIDDVWLGRRLEAIGYGVTAFEGGGGGVKRHVDIPIVGYGAAWPDGDGMVVLNDPVEGRDSCQGDSGGPNVYIRGDGYVQVAITSYGDGCGSGGGGWNVRTDLYIDWIEDTAGIQVQTDFVRPPRFVCSHQLNPGSPTSIAFGRLPMALQCAIDSGDPETIEEVTWFWGDGSSAEVSSALTASHTYTEMGVYSLRACISGVRGENPYTECQLVPNHVTACGVPQVSFSATPREGLRIEVENQTSLRAPACVTNVQWDVFSGPAIAGTPLFSHSTWQPDLDLSEHGPGVYTIVLNAGGIGGTGAARATVEVGRGRGCSTTPGGSLPSLALLVLPLVVRRRR